MKQRKVMVFLMFIVLTGCTIEPQKNDGTQTGGEEASYAAILRLNEAEYYSVGNENHGEYTIQKELGKVKERLPAEVLPREQLVSNYLDEGTRIFSVKEDRNVLLAKKDDDEYWEIFVKQNTK